MPPPPPRPPNTIIKDLTSLAKYIQSDACKSIVVLTGAGISVNSGIPDFRSAGGMYSTLRADLLTCSAAQRRLMEQDPTYVVSWDIFQRNAFPYLEVRRPFILGTAQQQWKATLSHHFLKLLDTKTNKLTRVYTQNIDGLDHQCFPDNNNDNKIVSVHGTIAQVACEGCGTGMEFDAFCQQVQSNIKDIYDPSLSDDEKKQQTSKPIHCPSCQQPLVKPKTVLFGRSLPEEFFVAVKQDMPQADLLIVAGTSLVVSPANSLVYQVNDDCARVVINQEAVGQELGIEYDYTDGSGGNKRRDYFAKGDCDQVCLELCQALGWEQDLLAIQDSLPEMSRAVLLAAASNKPQMRNNSK
ncbi:unnamed protein product [Cylindrotheca closterium]|uniref:Deacetylase sirtuin-type domain-containing protein n=1 Tax=Cylindrotheca closterium TaxID=2856 RepID=A0AAD2G2J9_9STRA|nr:unnamed protein product [Cylindrotheca closterium]